MNLEKLFSTRQRIAILQEVIFLEKEFGVSELARRLGLSKGLISKYLEILEDEGLLERKKGKYTVTDSKEVKSVKIMFHIQGVDTEVFKRYKFVRAAGLYGSCSKGTSTGSSDTDLWIKIKKTSSEKLAQLTSELRREIRNVRILVLDEQKLQTIKKEDPLFYHSLFFGSLIVYGEEDSL